MRDSDLMLRYFMEKIALAADVDLLALTLHAQFITALCRARARLPDRSAPAVIMLYWK